MKVFVSDTYGNLISDHIEEMVRLSNEGVTQIKNNEKVDTKYICIPWSEDIFLHERTKSMNFNNAEIIYKNIDRIKAIPKWQFSAIWQRIGRSEKVSQELKDYANEFLYGRKPTDE